MINKLILFVYIILNTFCFNAQTFKEQKKFGNNPGNLKLFSFNDSLSKNKPVVFILHGCSQNASDIEYIAGWQKLALKNNFVLMYPQQKIVNNLSLCFNWFLQSDINNNGECKSIYNMIRYAIDTLKVDSTKIFVYGVSAGACMAQVICANYPWLINKAAICAGIPFKAVVGIKAFNLMGKTIIKTPEEWGKLIKEQNLFYKGKYPKIIIVHGTQDFVADYSYSKEIIKQWANVNAISYEADTIIKNFENNTKVDKYFYQSISNKNAVVFYKIIGLGHKIPVDTGVRENQGGKDKLFSENIGFFSTYYIAKDFGLTK